jgi:predicted small metal-binding protein
MDKRLDCRDLNMDYEYCVCVQTEREVLEKAERHIQIVHKMKGFSKDFYEKVQASVRDDYCNMENRDAAAGGTCYAEACLYMAS